MRPVRLTSIGSASGAASECLQQIDQCTGSPQTLSSHSACQTNMSCAGGAQASLRIQQGGSHCGNYASLGIVGIAWEMFQKKESLP
jgi:hypothetical protein